MSTRQVKVTKILEAKKWQVLRLITHVEDFPRFMPNVKQVSVLEKTSRGAVTCWSVEIDKIPISWKEKDEFDLKKGIIRFQIAEGDIEKFEGEWRLEATPSGGTEVTVEATVKIGIPLIENVLGDAFAQKLELNFSNMLAVMAERLVVSRYKKIGRRMQSDLRGFGVIAHPYNFNRLDGI